MPKIAANICHACFCVCWSCHSGGAHLLQHTTDIQNLHSDLVQISKLFTNAPIAKVKVLTDLM